jgi:hypothetical protein
MSMDARRIFQVSGVNDISHPRHRAYQVTKTQLVTARNCLLYLLLTYKLTSSFLSTLLNHLRLCSIYEYLLVRYRVTRRHGTTSLDIIACVNVELKITCGERGDTAQKILGKPFLQRT